LYQELCEHREKKTTMANELSKQIPSPTLNRPIFKASVIHRTGSMEGWSAKDYSQ
jgi:hypothetical protein